MIKFQKQKFVAFSQEDFLFKTVQIKSNPKISLKKNVKYFESETSPKIGMRTTLQNWSVRPEMIIKWPEHQINQTNRRFSQKKVCLLPQKCKAAKNSYHNKMVGTPIQPIKSKIVFFVIMVTTITIIVKVTVKHLVSVFGLCSFSGS
jgi:hypothetical protein